MSQREELITISYHTDDDTGMYRVGEVDFGICSGVLERYLKNYGRQGRDEIIVTLAHLASEVIAEFKKQQDGGKDQTCQDAKVEAIPASPTDKLFIEITKESQRGVDKAIQDMRIPQRLFDIRTPQEGDKQPVKTDDPNFCHGTHGPKSGAEGEERIKNQKPVPPENVILREDQDLSDMPTPPEPRYIRESDDRPINR